ncbi:MULTISPECIES: substrate-binding domain-containing protein [unclassified Bradyrhizobium]|uniref:substrate-binding domain-containing protein n=1 Tax=Bradyrhizobium TaxID=374 RepID=UPI00040466BE|nr:nitrile hydratase [Bradyrhizobium elkanii]OCX32141.1 nitrile hydratase [Bradyrhizobium sp. UASWS1016]
MHSTLNVRAGRFNGNDNLPFPPSLLFKNLASAGSDRVLAPMDRSRFGPRGARNRLRVAGFVCCTGSPGMWGPATTSAAQLAVAEINRRGGILGREIELSVYDAGGPLEEVLDRAEQAIAFDEADLVMGMHTSAVRVALRKVTRGRIPYIYTAVYEGGERTPGVVAIGETPRWQIRPSIHWLAETRRATRWYLIGSDYVWPWQSHRAVKRYIKETGGLVVGEEFVPVGEDDHEAQLERIRAAKPDVVLISLIGTDSVTFNRAFADAGLASTTLRFAGCVDETSLLGIGADKTENLFCASGYFPSVGSHAGDGFRDRYRAMFGPYAPPVGSCGESAYEGFCLLEAAANRAGTLDMRPLLAAADNLVYRGPRGPVTVRSGHARMPMYLAEADGLDFRVIKAI